MKLGIDICNAAITDSDLKNNYFEQGLLFLCRKDASVFVSSIYLDSRTGLYFYHVECEENIPIEEMDEVIEIIEIGV
jgi:hypothetical protein